jgi:MinD superfamily P-loop ATPase
MFRVDPVKCTACGLCMDVCPTANIQKDALGRPQWDHRCLACLSCEMKCPEDAITSALSRPFPGMLIRLLFRYNVRRWIAEGELDHVRVVHQRGETHRIEATAASNRPNPGLDSDA